MKKCKNKKAFTLVEILAVIVILGILILIAIPSVNNYIEKSKRKAFFASVSNIVNKIKPENLIEEQDFCMYNYSDDKKNQTKDIDSMYVLAHKENDQIIYSVFAKRQEDTIDIDVYDFNELTMDNTDKWVQDNERSYSAFEIKLLGLISNNLDLTQLSKYKICGIEE